MDNETLANLLRNIAARGIVNFRESDILLLAADRLEEQEERIAIMEEGNGLLTDDTKGA